MSFTKMKILFKKYFILSMFIHIKIYNRIFDTPLYYNNNGYVLFTNKYINKILKNCEEENIKIYEFDFIGVGFSRCMNNCFNRWGSIVNISNIFHGRSKFELSDLYYNSFEPILKGNSDLFDNPLQKNEYLYVDGEIEPVYEVKRAGIIIGFDSSYKNNNFWKITFRSRLPIQQLSILNNKSWHSFKPYEEFIETIDDTPAKTTFNDEFIYNTISGLYKNGYKDYWSSYSIQGIGDLNLELDYILNFLNNKLVAYGMIGLILPTGIIENKLNYLSLPLNNNGHYELRLGSQISYDLLSFCNIILYGSYGYAFSAIENIISSYKGANAFNMQPTQTFANISWNQAIFSIDTIFSISSFFGFTFGYQFFYKGKDVINSIQEYNYDGVNEYNLLNYEFMESRSKRIANKARGSFYLNLIDCLQIEFGGDIVFYGYEIPQENEIYARISYSY